MSDKLLHEKMRELTERCTLTEFASITLNNGEKVTCLNRSELIGLADEIERYYIPRPLYDDWEPVQWGDDVDGRNGKLKALTLFPDGSGVAYGSNDTVPLLDGCGAEFGAYGDRSHRLMRHAPKLLDADGVELKIGDTVWHVVSDRRGTVELCKAPIVIVDWDDGGFSAGIPAASLTHKEPDSLETLRDDMREAVESWADDEFDWLESRKWADRLTALIEKGA